MSRPPPPRHDADSPPLDALKRRIYLSVTTTSIIAWSLFLAFTRAEASESLLRSTLTAYLVVEAVMTASLWRFPRTQVAIERVRFVMGATALLLPRAVVLFGSADHALHSVATTDFAAWAPLLYVWAFFTLGIRGGIIGSVSFLVASGCLFGVHSAVQPDSPARAAELAEIGKFFMGGITYIILLSGFAFFLQRHLRHLAKAEATARYAYHDPLTGLPNRLLLADRLERAVTTAHRTGTPFAVLFLDLDGFKAVNDTHGHHVGDELLKHVSDRLKSSLRHADTVARISGDEFAIVAHGPADDDALHEIARKLLSAFQMPYPIEGNEITVTSSIGISRYPDDGATADELLNRADSAMYQAKKRGKNRYARHHPEAGAPAPVEGAT